MNGPFANDFELVKAYAKAIVEGRKVACIEQIQGCQRFLDDLASNRWDIRTHDAEFVVGVIQRTFKHKDGEDLQGRPLRGTAFLLEPWEKFIVYNLLVFYVKDTDERRFKEAFIFVPRKNGKTIFISALSWALAILHRKSGSTIYVVGAVLREAMKSFKNWLYNITQVWYADKKDAQADGWRILDNNMEHSISNEDIEGGSVHLEALAGNPDAQDSLSCNIAIADEIHAYKTPKQYNIIKEAMKAFTNKLMIGITTAGDNIISFCGGHLKYCQKILAGIIKDRAADALFIFICKADEDEKGNVDYTSAIEHEKANPNYGVTIRPDDIMNDALQAQNDPQKRKDFLSKSLNIYTSAMKAYFNLKEFQLSNEKAREVLGLPAPPETLEPGKRKQEYAKWLDCVLRKLASLPITWYGGADLSKLHDLTAAALHGSYKGIDICIPHCWFPIVAAHAKAEDDGIPLFGWEEEGWLTMSNSPTTNHAEIVNWFKQMREMGFKIKQVGHDRKFKREYYIGMKKAGFKVVDQPQYFYKKSEGFRRIETKAKDGNFNYLGSSAYEYCVNNVQAIEKTDDMIEYSKIEPEHRIDIFDADVFGTVRMLEDLEQSQNAKQWLE